MSLQEQIKDAISRQKDGGLIPHIYITLPQANEIVRVNKALLAENAKQAKKIKQLQQNLLNCHEKGMCGYTADRLAIVEADLAKLRELIDEIEAVSCGEKQVVDDDSEGMGWIYKRILALKEQDGKEDSQ